MCLYWIQLGTVKENGQLRAYCGRHLIQSLISGHRQMHGRG